MPFSRTRAPCAKKLGSGREPRFSPGGIAIKVFLFGYYGLNNYGDEILLRTVFKLLRENPVEEVRLLFPRKGSRKINGIPVFHVCRNRPMDIRRAISECDCVVGGGGGIFQDQTSQKSFLYYDWLVSRALKWRKPVLLLGHGLGPIHAPRDAKHMRKILSHPLCWGFFRDEVSARYAAHFSKNHTWGSDLAYGYLEKRDKPKQVRGRLGLVLKSHWANPEDFIPFFQAGGFTEIVLMAAFPDQEMKEMKRLEKAFSGSFRLFLKKGEDVNEMTDTIASCSLVVSERLHGALVASYFGVPLVVSKGFKMGAFFRNFHGFRATFQQLNIPEMAMAFSRLHAIDFAAANAAFCQQNIARYREMIAGFSERLQQLS